MTHLKVASATQTIYMAVLIQVFQTFTLRMDQLIHGTEWAY